MLSHSKLSSSADATSYYKADDYYSEYGAAPAKWIGQGAGELNFDSTFNVNDFSNALEGRGPKGETLGVMKSGKRAVGWDFTFSPSKSVSILALAMKDDRLIQAHDKAVVSAITYLEKNYAVTRVTKNGETKPVRTGNLLVAAFRHAISRERDPQLHTHAVIVNTTKTKDGNWRALDSKTLYAAHSAASLVYTNALARGVLDAGYHIDQTDASGGRMNYGCLLYTSPSPRDRG